MFQSRDRLTGNLPGQSNHESPLYSARKKKKIPPLLLTSCAGYLAVPAAAAAASEQRRSRAFCQESGLEIFTTARRSDSKKLK